MRAARESVDAVAALEKSQAWPQSSRVSCPYPGVTSGTSGTGILYQNLPGHTPLSRIPRRNCRVPLIRPGFLILWLHRFRDRRDRSRFFPPDHDHPVLAACGFAGHVISTTFCGSSSIISKINSSSLHRRHFRTSHLLSLRRCKTCHAVH